MSADVAAKFLEEGVKVALQYDLTSASLLESKTSDGHVRTVTERMVFDYGAFREGLQPTDADKLIAGLRAAHLSPPQITHAIDETHLADYHKQILHEANPHE